MATLVLSLAGSLVPGLGPVLGPLGGLVGNWLDKSLLFPAEPVRGPRLESLRLQDSSYGAGLARLYGQTRLSGNVLWMSDLRETVQREEVGGKGGGGQEVQTYSYSVDCAIALCEGPIDRVHTVWADGKVIYDGRWKSETLANAQIYVGSTAQTPDPLMESHLGSGNVPAYRGIAYLVFTDLQLANFGNRLPSFTFEVSRTLTAGAPQQLGVTAIGIKASPFGYDFIGQTPVAAVRASDRVEEALVCGAETSGTQVRIVVLRYDVTGNAPQELSRIQSTYIDAGSSDVPSLNWRQSADGNWILISTTTDNKNRNFILYDVNSRSFGPWLILPGSGTAYPHLYSEWVDGLTALVTDMDASSAYGVRLLRRIGNSLQDGGFTSLWTFDAAKTQVPGVGFLKVPSGMVQIAGGTLLGLEGLVARHVSFNGSGLSLGSEYSITLGYPSVSNSVMALPMGEGEYAILLPSGGGRIDCATGFFTASGFTITRAWATLDFDTGGGLIDALEGRVFWMNGNLGCVFRTLAGLYAYGEIALTSSGFSIGVAAQAISGSSVANERWSAFAIDHRRFLNVRVSGQNLVEVQIHQRTNGQSGLAGVLGSILEDAGYLTADYDLAALSSLAVDGYALPEPMTARAAIEPLRLLAPFDLVESDGKLKARVRSNVADWTVPSTELRAAAEEQATPSALETIRAQELDLPREVTVDHLDRGRDYQVSTQRARRLAGAAEANVKLTLPMVAAASVAKQVAETRLYSAWAERTRYRLRFSRRYFGADTGDVINVDGLLLRLQRLKQNSGFVEAEAVPVISETLASAAVGEAGAAAERRTTLLPDTYLHAMDLPALRSEDDRPGIYVAVSAGEGFPGASVWRARDGVTFQSYASFGVAATAGYAASALASGPTPYMDRRNSVDVVLRQGSLQSLPIDALLNGGNLALIGNELVQFQTATLLGAGYYRLSNLLRGRLGSEAATAGHSAGESFVLLTQEAVQFVGGSLTDRSQSVTMKAVTVGQLVGNVMGQSVTYNLRSLRPLSPVHVRGTRPSVGGDLTLRWVRRARINAGWVDAVDVPLDETREQYDVEILNGLSVVRTLNISDATNVIYTAAQQSADFGSPPASVSVRIYQLSDRAGRGDAASATV